MEKLLFIECNMGAAGDMLAGALYELLPKEKQEEFLDIMKKNPLNEVRVSPISVEKSGVCGTHMKVEIHGKEEGEYHHHHDHDHSNLHSVEHSIDHFLVPDEVKKSAKAVYGLIAEAEAKVHQKPVSQVHFHEVGSLDAIVDVVSVCWMLHVLNPKEVIVSDINVGYGSVWCAHGKLPVPAPAVALLLKGAPCYQGEFEVEMCTPTGAALLQYAKTRFGKMPIMCLENIGYGMGSKDFAQVNCVRVFLGSKIQK